MSPNKVPNAVFHTRVRNESIAGPNPFEWKDIETDELFAGTNVVLFALPGAFTPACSDSHLPGYEQHYDEFVVRWSCFVGQLGGVSKVYSGF